MGCTNHHVEEETLIKAYLMAWNALVENREDFMEQWTERRLNVKMKRSKKRCRLGVAIPDRHLADFFVDKGKSEC